MPRDWKHLKCRFQVGRLSEDKTFEGFETVASEGQTMKVEAKTSEGAVVPGPAGQTGLATKSAAAEKHFVADRCPGSLLPCGDASPHLTLAILD